MTAPDEVYNWAVDRAFRLVRLVECLTSHCNRCCPLHVCEGTVIVGRDAEKADDWIRINAVVKMKNFSAILLQ